MKLTELPLAWIVDPSEPVRARISSEGIDELAESIREVGLLQPILVKPRGDEYEVITGHRRLLACRRIQLGLVPCLVLEEGEGAEIVAQRLHENLFRRDMTAIEEAVVYAELFEVHQDIDKVAAMAHVSRATVERKLAVLQGNETVRDALHDEKISLGVAEQLNKLTDADMIRYLLDCAIRDGASVEKVRLWVSEYRGVKLTPVDPANPGGSNDPAGEVLQDPNICWLCGSSEEQHDLRVRLVHATCERIARQNAERIEYRRRADED